MNSQEDLFEGTTMTFGEHLEELRVCLVRAMVGLVIGSLIGLLLAKNVVGIIQIPLSSALEEHYSKLAVLELQNLYGSDVDPTLVNFVEKTRLIFEEVYVEKMELRRVAEVESKSVSDGTTGSVTTETTTVAESTKTELERLFEEKLPVPVPAMVKTRVWRPADAQLTTLSPHESFIIWMKAGLVAGLILASPYIFYQVWIFVAAGLYPHERKYIYIYLPFSLALFLAGAAMAFFFVFGPVLDFLFGFARMLDIDPDLRISEVISFVLFLPLGFGVAFQLPLVMLFLNRIGVFSIQNYLEKWRIAILVIFIISMMLTPADPYSMLLMAVPLTLLYFLGLLLCHWMPRGKNPFSDPYEPGQEAPA